MDSAIIMTDSLYFRYNFDGFRYNEHSYQVRPFAIINFSSFI